MTIKAGRFLSFIAWAIAFCVIHIPRSSAQKYNFTRFGIENGLNQSQAVKIAQDAQNNVWISTFDGINRYDGKNFSTVPNEPGSLTNFSTSIHAANNGDMWLGCFNHICRYQNGHYTSYPVKDGKPGWVYKLAIDSTGTVWGTANTYLYTLKNNQLVKVSITAPTDTIIGMATNNHGVLYAAVYKKGIYYFTGGQWHNANINAGAFKSDLIRGIAFDPADDSKMYAASDVKLYLVQNGSMTPYLSSFLKGDNFHLFCLLAEKGSLWIGSSKGAYLWRDNKMEHFTGDNGFTNYSVLDIYRDRDGNVWLGSDGDGVYKFDENGFQVYDQSSGLIGPVMAIDKDRKGNILVGTLGSGSFILNGSGVAKTYIPPSNPAHNKTVYAIYTDSQGTTWIGNDYSGLWKETASGYKKITTADGPGRSMFVKAIAEDGAHTIWVATNTGCYYVDNEKLMNVPGALNNYTSMLLFGDKIALAGRQTGIVMVSGKKVIASPKFKALDGLTVLAMAVYKDYIYAGTSEKGIFAFTLGGRLIKNYSKQTGLASNSIYCMKADGNKLWAGTGRSIDKFKINPRTGELSEDNNPFSHLVVECNQGAITLSGGKIYVGTVKNIVVSDTATIKKSIEPPHTVMSAVKTYLTDAEDSAEPGDTTVNRAGLQLPYDNSHITFYFHGIQISDYEKVLFKYRLIGERENIAQKTNYEYVNYPSLLPGHYTFLVEAFIPGGPGGNTVTFSFDVLPAFYQTSLFRAVAVCSFILLLIGIYKYKVYQDKRNRQKIEQLRMAEQELVRRRTAEDFHDDLGNKLTRISVLTHILDDKVAHEEAEIKEIIGQIRSSAVEIYGGTKDILWALNPENDYLNEVINFIVQFANELFSHTNISFTLADNVGPLGEAKLPIGFGRNIILIAKELLNNILRHAQAANVSMAVSTNGDNIAIFEFKDDGAGFDMEHIKPGNGLKNIKNRAKKINGEITVCSTAGKGTTVELKFEVLGRD